MNPHDLNSASLLSLSWHRLKRRPPPEFPERRPSLFKSGRNIWKKAHASKVSFLIDADAFFRSFVEAAVKAERELIIVGWDTDSRTKLPWPPGFTVPGVPTEESIRLGDFLTALAASKPNLRIYVLSWDFAFIYLLERETLPGVRFSALGTDRIRFVLDKEHPFWASHHQKIVVVDDQVAFSGGLDLTQRRWDTREHRGQDQRRVDPTGQKYGPFHDVQICMQGAVAHSLGNLVRERWRVATGETLNTVSPKGVDDSYWPASARVAMTDVEVGIARTEPIGYTSAGQNPYRCVREVERLFLDSIRSARRFIYIENQYFTSPAIARALAKKLEERSGPDIVMVLPRDQTGWIEEGTMGLLRSEAIRMVQASDRYGRFKVFYPVVPDLGKGYLKVHSKVMVIDDVFVRVGSANLNSRSMGLDTECDIAIEAVGSEDVPEDVREDVRDAIASLRADLLGEHLGVDPAEFEARFKAMGSLLRTVDSFRGGSRDLFEIPLVPQWMNMISPPGEWLDPVGPKGIRRWINKRLVLNRDWMGPTFVLGVLLFLLILHNLEASGFLKIDPRSIPDPWEWIVGAYSWLRSWNAEKVAAFVSEWRGSPVAIPAVILFFTIGSFLFVPITAMILGVALAYPKGEAIVLALGSAMVASLATYGLGRYWAWSKSRFLARPWIQSISRQMERGGLWVVLLIRLAPIAPFTAVSIVAGGLRIRLRDYMIGTFLGLLPGSLALTLLSQEAAEAVGQANWMRLVLTVLAMGIFFLVLPRFFKRLRRSA